MKEITAALSPVAFESQIKSEHFGPICCKSQQHQYLAFRDPAVSVFLSCACFFGRWLQLQPYPDSLSACDSIGSRCSRDCRCVFPANKCYFAFPDSQTVVFIGRVVACLSV